MKKPRLVVSVVNEELRSAHAAVNELFGAKGVATVPLEGTAPGGVAAAKKASSMYGVSNEEMARLFNEKIRVFGHVEFSAAAVVFALLKLLLKAWVEYLRGRVLSKHAMHQMQVDVHALRAGVAQYWTASSPEWQRVVDALVAEVELAAEDRCVEPAPLTATVITAILASATEAEEGEGQKK